MSNRIDRRIGSGPLFLTAAAIVLVAGVALSLWLRMAGEQVSADIPQTKEQSAQALQYDEPVTLTAYVPVNGILALRQLAVKRQADTQAQARRTLEAMLADQQTADRSVLKEVRLRSFFIDAKGTGYIDLAPVSEAGVRASAWAELLALYAFVNTVMQNFEEIRQIHFLLDGKEAPTLAGHIDCSRPFTKRMDLVLQ